ncbi:MAG: APC family permease [Candidatus Nanohalobium sp.]
MSQKVGLKEAVSMAVGGMVGGGIFAVLGVVASSAGPLAWMAFIVSGVIALASGYSMIRLNSLTEGKDSPITFIHKFTGSKELAGMTGWTFLFGYIGTMAMYAFAFGGYFEELAGIQHVLGFPLRPVISLLVVVIFVGLNVLGAHASGETEDILVLLKVIILLVFGLGGLYYGFTHGMIGLGFANFGFGPLIAAAISFVAFEGWELLLFDQDSLRNAEETLKKAIYASILIATFLYVIVAVVTTNLLTPSVIAKNAETALAIAAKPFLGSVGFVLISLAALFSTGSAINATLFSSARLSRKLVSDKLLPAELRGSGDEPVKSLLALGGLTAAFTVLGSLNAITSFASLAFITIFGAVSFLAFREGDSLVTRAVPLLGFVGSVSTVLALLYHLRTAEPEVFSSVILIAIGVISAELLYFERDEIEEEVKDVEEEVEEEEEEVREEIEDMDGLDKEEG